MSMEKTVGLEDRPICPGVHQFGKPLIFPCCVSHTRLFPKAHRFSYSYLMVGVPIQDEGIKGSVLSTDSSSETNGWFSLHGEDNLERSLGPCSLNRKINEYLASQVGIRGSYR